MTLLERSRKKASDEYYTQAETVELIEEVLRPFIKGRPIYCPFDAEWSQFVKVLKAKGYDVKNTWDDYKNHEADFKAINEAGGVVVSNPPFSIYHEIVDNFKKWGVEFYLLANLIRCIDAYKWGIFGSYLGHIDFILPDGTTKGVAIMLTSNKDIRGITDKPQMANPQQILPEINGIPHFKQRKLWDAAGRPTPAYLCSTWILSEASKHYNFKIEEIPGYFALIKVEGKK